MPWITLQISSMLLMSIHSILDKRLIRDHISSPIIQLASFAFVGLPVVLVGFWLVPWPGIKAACLGLFTGLIFSAVVMLYYRAMDLEDVSRLVPILRLSGVLQLTLLALLLNDRLTLLQYLAFALMSLGTFTLTWRARLGHSIVRLRFVKYHGILLMGVVAFLMAINGLIDSQLILSYSPWVLIVWSNLGTILGFCLVLLVPWQRKEFLKGALSISLRFRGIIIGQQITRLLISLLADLAVNQAGSAAITAVLGGLRPLMVLVMAMIFLGERLDSGEILPKLVGFSLIMIGTGLVML